MCWALVMREYWGRINFWIHIQIHFHRLSHPFPDAQGLTHSPSLGLPADASGTGRCAWRRTPTARRCPWPPATPTRTPSTTTWMPATTRSCPSSSRPAEEEALVLSPPTASRRRCASRGPWSAELKTESRYWNTYVNSFVHCLLDFAPSQARILVCSCKRE